MLIVFDWNFNFLLNKFSLLFMLHLAMRKSSPTVTYSSLNGCTAKPQSSYEKCPCRINCFYYYYMSYSMISPPLVPIKSFLCSSLKSKALIFGLILRKLSLFITTSCNTFNLLSKINTLPSAPPVNNLLKSWLFFMA